MTATAEMKTSTGDLRVIRDQHGCLLVASEKWGTLVVAESDVQQLIADLIRASDF
jgi:hypothetical protein